MDHRVLLKVFNKGRDGKQYIELAVLRSLLPNGSESWVLQRLEGD